MALADNTPAPSPTQAQYRAEGAFAAHCALVRYEVANPWLKDNPDWQLRRADAYEAMFVTMGVMP